MNLCAALAKRNRKVLLADCDPQGNSTSGMGVSKDKMPNVYDLLLRGAPASDCIVKTNFGDVLPSNKELSGASVELVEEENREFVLKTRLLALREDYDYIFIDCPPSLELLTVNALAAADSVLIPVQCEYYALEGIADLMTTIKLTKKRLNPGLEDTWALCLLCLTSAQISPSRSPQRSRNSLALRFTKRAYRATSG